MLSSVLFDDILLGRLADGITVLADLEQRIEQLAVAREHVSHGVGVGETVVRLLDASGQGEPRDVDLLELGVGVARGQRCAKIPCAGVGQVLADHDAMLAVGSTPSPAPGHGRPLPT
jgi:hypothetical protein